MIKRKIERYQTEGDKTLIDDILELVDKDLRVMMEDHKELSPETFIAYRIKSFLMKAVYRKVYFRNIYENGKSRNDYWELQDYAQVLSRELDIEMTNHSPASFILEYEWDTITIFPHEWIKVLSLARHFEEQDKRMVEESYMEYKSKLLPLFVEGLKQALSLVDTSRNPKEIVKFINIVMFRKMKELQLKESGKIRVFDKEKGKEVIIKPKFEADTWKLLLNGKTLKHVGEVNAGSFLTKKQRAFLRSAYEIAKEELENQNREAFHFNPDSSPRICKRFVSRKMDMTESAFKMTLMRCQRRIDGNWQEIVRGL